MKAINFFIALLFITSISGKTTLWISNLAGDWEDASNWSDGVPASGDSAIISFGGSVVSIQTAAHAEYIFVGENTKLKVMGNLLIENSEGDAFRAEGMVSVLGGSVSIVNPQGEGLLVMDSLYNNGTIYIQDVKNWPFSGLSVEDGGRLENAAAIIINNCRIGFRNSQGYLWNRTSGSINTIACSISFRQSDLFSINEGTFGANAGYLNVIEGGRLNHRAGANVTISGGGLIVDKNSILDTYGMISIEGGFGIRVYFQGTLNLMNGSVSILSQGIGDRLDTYGAGEINVEEGAIVTIQ